MVEGTVQLQSQEWRTVNEKGEEVFGETLYVNGSPIDKEPYGPELVEVARKVIKTLGFQTEVLEDLEPLDQVV